MQMTDAKRQIVDDAMSAGFKVREADTYVEIYRTDRWGNVTCGLMICENGIATRLDVRSDHALAIRSHKVMRKVLGI